jgi:hypothetical protein
VAQILHDVRVRMDQELLRHESGLLSRCLFPSPDQDEAVLRRGFDSKDEFATANMLSNAPLRHLLDETRDYLSRFQFNLLFQFFLF